MEKTIPRDIDIALIWTVEEFGKMFSAVGYDEWGGSPLWNDQAYQDKRCALYVSAQKIVHYDTRIDVRLCPDIWWPEKDKLILGTPSDIEPQNMYGDIKFEVYDVVR